jgi:hypothetical protein
MRARGQGISFADPVDTLPASREAALAVVWRLIARGLLAVDLSAPIVANSRVTHRERARHIHRQAVRLG